MEKMSVQSLPIRSALALTGALLLISPISYAASQATSSQTTSGQKVSFDYDGFINSVEQQQQQRMQQLIQHNQALNSAVRLACQPSDHQALTTSMKQWSNLQDLQTLWRNSAQQWQKVQVFPLGPNTDTTVRLNITFWPDKKNLVERKVKGLIKQGETVDLTKGGIASQGLAASEYLLFDPRHLQKSSVQQSCPALLAVSAQSLSNSQMLLTRWQDSEFREHWHDAGLGNDTFASTSQAAGYLLAGLAQGAEIIAKDKVYKPFRLNKEKAKANVYLAENWRSGLSLSNIQQNITDLKQLYKGIDGKNGPYQLLQRKGFQSEAESIAQKLDQVQGQISQLAQMKEQAFQAAQGREWAKSIYKNLMGLEKALKKPLPHFNLAQKFNSRDGD